MKFLMKDHGICLILLGLARPEFHDAFGIANGNSPQGQLDEGTVRLRHRLMAEETEEYLEAALAGDAVEVADYVNVQKDRILQKPN